MFARDQIFDILEQLPMWHWPVFFWDLICLELYRKVRIEAGDYGLVGVGVSRTGRIHIILDARADAPREHWSDYVPVAPWEKLAPGAAIAALPAAALGLILILADAVGHGEPSAAPALAGTGFIDSG